jgi:hypothetical protein
MQRRVTGSEAGLRPGPRVTALAFAGLSALGCAGTPATPDGAPTAVSPVSSAPVAERPTGGPPSELAASPGAAFPVQTERFACSCAVGGADDEPAEGAACTLTIRQGMDARLDGTTRKDSEVLPILGEWQVVPVPAGRVEPEPFVRFRGPLTVGGATTSVEVRFIDNLMYTARLGDAGPALHLTCNPPE